MRPAEPFLTERLNFYEEFRGRAGKTISKARVLQALFTPPSDIIQPVKDKREASLSIPATNPLSPFSFSYFPSRGYIPPSARSPSESCHRERGIWKNITVIAGGSNWLVWKATLCHTPTVLDNDQLIPLLRFNPLLKGYTSRSHGHMFVEQTKNGYRRKEFGG